MYILSEKQCLSSFHYKKVIAYTTASVDIETMENIVPVPTATQQRVAAHATHIRFIRERRSRGGGGMWMLAMLYLFIVVSMSSISIQLAFHERDRHKFSSLEQRVKLALLQQREPLWGAGGL